MLKVCMINAFDKVFIHYLGICDEDFNIYN
jgi:hypothetical protein